MYTVEAQMKPSQKRKHTAGSFEPMTHTKAIYDKF